jgi:hypothetical protein
LCWLNISEMNIFNVVFCSLNIYEMNICWLVYFIKYAVLVKCL